MLVNPGSTSTKIAVFDGEPGDVSGQRRATTPHALAGFELCPGAAAVPPRGDFEAALTDAGRRSRPDRGGRGADAVALEPMDGGTYPVNAIMLETPGPARSPTTQRSWAASSPRSSPTPRREAYVVNPPDVDEFDEVARVTGLGRRHPAEPRHALNQKEVAHRYAATVAAVTPISTWWWRTSAAGSRSRRTGRPDGRLQRRAQRRRSDGPTAPGSLPARDVIRIVLRPGGTPSGNCPANS